jgi:hypothetical protein
MTLFPSKNRNDERQVATEEIDGLSETSPLLQSSAEDDSKPGKSTWKPPPGFIWIEVGKSTIA